MKWEDNNAYNRSLSDAGYLLTWAFTKAGRWMNAWAPRQQGQRRGKHLGAGHERKELERICVEHHAKNVSRDFWASVEMRP